MNIYLIRHGATAGNLEHRYVGSTDEGLTEESIQAIRSRRSSYPVPEFVFTSPMVRCRQTAELLYPEIPKAEIQNLRECEFGAFEYKNYLELQGDEDYQAWIDSGGMLAFPGGESREQFIRRCALAFQEACRAAEQKTYRSIAFVVHGGTIMAVLDQFSSPHRDYFDWQPKNGGGFRGKLEHGPSGWMISEIQKLP